jgi:hypothetical protein
MEEKAVVAKISGTGHGRKTSSRRMKMKRALTVI